MTKFLKTSSGLVLAASLLFSCDQFKVTQDADGSKYQIHELGNGKKAKEGDIVTFDLIVKAPNDTVFTNTYKRGEPIMMRLQKGAFKGSFENSLFHISEGDSATIFVSSDSLFIRAQQPMPAGVAKGSDMQFLVKVKKVQTMEDFEKAQQAKKNDEVKIMDEYAKKNFPNATKTQYGMYRVVVKEGTGATITAGKSVKVEYTGKLITGKVFDSSVGKDPLELTVGQGMVIPGWEQALMMMKKGEKSIFFIPSNLAYGEQGAGGVIPPYSPLIFEMEIIDVK
ncbi:MULTISPECIES: FKBP-type peptidyl-prolyl cis-trans isomerase [Emticicia]|uniref:FKBP-type peptidyl-prolyl cis-trans isomerase n=1 Tax=Emticicia TaxID=312278 RepID=UPI000C76CDC7|nr:MULTISPECIES: FKBP-type peptidyl-prolyl cis-trans isomerase [Emticicia]PLK46217.1 peptidylprolyl isomerase [Emticicia sp. TH156]UTA67995.1 FKBP-type peptidyl-prolyl cis-trans isomerase [Emticicia sp. 21SJ11W-3]